MTHRLYPTWSVVVFFFLLLLLLLLFFCKCWPGSVLASPGMVCNLVFNFYRTCTYSFKMLVYCIKNCSPKSTQPAMVSQGWRGGSFVPRPHSRKRFSPPTQPGYKAIKRREAKEEDGSWFVIPPLWAGISTRVLLEALQELWSYSSRELSCNDRSSLISSHLPSHPHTEHATIGQDGLEPHPM